MHPDIIMFAEQRRASLAKVKDFVGTAKPVVNITLTDDQKDKFAPQYTSLDEIKGEVSITASCDTSFDNFYISFEGVARTYVEKIATASPTNGRTEACHPFIRLVQPIEPSALPEPRVIEAGKVYKFPFTFVVPDTLLPVACTHDKKPGFPDGGHLTLPPTLGDPLVVSTGRSLMDDLTPDMSKIGAFFSSSFLYVQGCSMHITVALKVLNGLEIPWGSCAGLAAVSSEKLFLEIGLRLVP